MSQSQGQPGSNPNNLKALTINGFFLLLGALVGYLGTRANADAQVSSAKEAAKAQVTSAAINVYGPIFATQTAEAKVTPVPVSLLPATSATDLPSPTPTSEPSSLALEQIPQNIFVYAGNNNPDGGGGVFDLFYDEEHLPVYQMTYSLPSDKYGYAGLVFKFPKGYNLSEYRAIEFKILFREPTDQVELFFKDIASNSNTILIATNGETEMDLRYLFTNFPNINFNALMEIGVFANTNLAQGDHQVKLQNVRFTR